MSSTKGRFAIPSRSEVRATLAAFRGALIGVAVFSGFSNLLMLTGAIFMLEVYDRVIPSRSVPTLVWLALLALALFVFQAAIDMVRARVLTRVAGSAAEQLSRRVHRAVVELALRSRGSEETRPVRDLDQIRSFLASGGPIAFFDLPWIPLYLLVCFGFHFWIGATATVGALVLLALTAAAEWKIRRPSALAAAAAAERNGLAETSRRNAEVLRSMGMAGRVGDRFDDANAAYLDAQQAAADISTGFGAVSKVARIALQSAVLGVGAYLVIGQEATAGVIIAGSILSARALAPVDLVIASWRNFEAARRGWKSLNQLLSALPEKSVQLSLPKPSIDVAVEAVSLTPPGASRQALDNVSFSLKAGSALGIIGPSAAGKSSLARTLVGVWTPGRGKIRLDGAAMEQWSAEALGAHVGYLPQDVELLDGTIAENIARLDRDASSEAVVAAARAAGVHDMVVKLADGYDTRIGEGGMLLSAGQRQRIALARALYGDPFLVVLDEPNSNLDSEGEAALTAAISGVRRRGGIVVVVAHRASALAAVDLILMLAEGRVQAFGPKEEVLAKLVRSSQPATKIAAGGR